MNRGRRGTSHPANHDEADPPHHGNGAAIWGRLRGGRTVRDRDWRACRALVDRDLCLHYGGDPRDQNCRLAFMTSGTPTPVCGKWTSLTHGSRSDPRCSLWRPRAASHILLAIHTLTVGAVGCAIIRSLAAPRGAWIGVAGGLLVRSIYCLPDRHMPAIRDAWRSKTPPKCVLRPLRIAGTDNRSHGLSGSQQFPSPADSTMTLTQEFFNGTRRVRSPVFRDRRK